MSMDGRYSARSQEGDAVMSMDGRYSARSQEGDAVMSMDGRAENCSSAIAPALPYYRPSMDICIFRTSTILGGRILQGARKAVVFRDKILLTTVRGSIIAV